MVNSESVFEFFVSLILVVMVNIANTANLRLFYHEEWKLFHHLVSRMNKNAIIARRVMSLWFCLEEFSYYGLICKIGSFDDQIVDSIFEETALCVPCIELNARQPTSIDDTPLLARLVEEPIDRRFFYYNKDILLDRFWHFMNTVCNRIFWSNTINPVHRFAAPPILRPFGETSSTHVEAGLLVNSSMTSETSAQGNQRLMDSTLNPNARPFIGQLPPREQRSMFVTFSRGYPLSKDEILEFFTSRWGQVVEDVIIEQTPEGIMPQYGTVVLDDTSVIPMILNGESKARFVVNGKHLWTRVYVPKRNEC